MMAHSQLVQVITDNKTSEMEARVYVRLWQGVAMYDVEISKLYVYQGQQRYTHRFGFNDLPGLRSLALQARKWIADNRSDIQAKVAQGVMPKVKEQSEEDIVW